MIVHPKSVVGIIQVKKNFDGDQLYRGIANVVTAKQHIFDLGRADNPSEKFYFDRRVFSAVIAFDGVFSQSTLQKCLTDLQQKHQAFEQPNDTPWHTSVLVLPDLVGTISEWVAVADNVVNRRGYAVYNSVHNGINIIVQILLWKLMRSTYGPSSLPFALPQLSKIAGISVGMAPTSTEP